MLSTLLVQLGLEMNSVVGGCFPEPQACGNLQYHVGRQRGFNSGILSTANAN